MDYAREAGLDSGMRRLFSRVMRELDEAYLGWQRDQQKTRTHK